MPPPTPLLELVTRLDLRLVSGVQGLTRAIRYTPQAVVGAVMQIAFTPQTLLVLHNQTPHRAIQLVAGSGREFSWPRVPAPR